MEMIDILKKSKEDLIAEKIKLKKDLLQLRFQKKTDELNNTSQFRKVRKTIARINTQISKLDRGQSNA